MRRYKKRDRLSAVSSNFIGRLGVMDSVLPEEPMARTVGSVLWQVQLHCLGVDFGAVVVATKATRDVRFVLETHQAINLY
jgi:hypothetical protein